MKKPGWWVRGLPVELVDLINGGEAISEIGRYLDWLDHDSRLREIRGLTAQEMAKLYGIAQKGVGPEDLLPKDFPSLKPVIFYGKNSLPVFTQFQKRMCRNDHQGIIGYNHQGMGWATGPGYFVIKDNSDRAGEVMIDYTETPMAKPDSWPDINSNNSGIARLVYGGMKDYLRRVSRDVFIGLATKKGKEIGQYFLLYRETLDNVKK